jgi:hypothetical protein
MKKTIITLSVLAIIASSCKQVMIAQTTNSEKFAINANAKRIMHSKQITRPLSPLIITGKWVRTSEDESYMIDAEKAMPTSTVRIYLETQDLNGEELSIVVFDTVDKDEKHLLDEKITVIVNDNQALSRAIIIGREWVGKTIKFKVEANKSLDLSRFD